MADDDRHYLYFSLERTEDGVENATKVSIMAYDRNLTPTDRNFVAAQLADLLDKAKRLQTWVKEKKTEAGG